MQLELSMLNNNQEVVICQFDDIQQLMEKMDSQLMGQAFQLEDVIGDIRISTVFIPQFCHVNAGYHFETAIFQKEKEVIIFKRYLTIEDAKKGHRECVADFII